MIDTNNEMQVKNYMDKLKILRNQVLSKGYTEDNLKVVITANMFPTNGVVLPAGKESYVFRNPSCSLGIVVRDRIKKVDGISNYTDDQLATLKLQSEKYMPYNTKYVSVVYAAINGLYPDYYATNFIIIDSFKSFLGSKSILSLRPETTLFNGSIQLSSEAVFLVHQKNFDDFNRKYPQLSKYKVVKYTGDAEKALSMYLVSIDIVPEKMTQDYVCESPTSYKFLDFVTNYANSNNIQLLKYDETTFYMDDQEKTQKLQKIYDAAFYKFLLKAVNIPKSHFDQLYDRLCEGDSYDPDNLIILDGIIESIGAENLVKIVNDFNSKIDEKIMKNNYQNNEEILDSGKLELD